jgi:hypothetical protein
MNGFYALKKEKARKLKSQDYGGKRRAMRRNDKAQWMDHPAGLALNPDSTALNARRLVSDAAPHLGGIDRFVWVQFLRFLDKDLGRLGIGWVRNAAIVDGTHRGALRLVKVPDAFRTPVVCNDVDVVPDSLTVSDMIALAFGIAAGFKDGLIGALRQASPA